MESFIDTILYSAIKFIFYVTLFASTISTIVIPTFFNDKMMKPQVNYIAGLSIGKRLSRLSKTGKLFIWCAIISVLLGFALSKLDSWESEVTANRHFKEILSIRLEYSDSINKLNSIKQVNELKDSVGTVRSILSNKNFRFESLSTELKDSRKQSALLEEQKMYLTKELNSPQIQESISPDNGKSHIIINDTSRNIMFLWCYFENVGKGAAVNIQKTFYVLDYRSLRYLYKTDETYKDTVSILTEGGIGAHAISISNDHSKKYIVFEIKYESKFRDKHVYMKAYLFDTSYIGEEIPKVNAVTSNVLFRNIIEGR